MMPYVKSHNVQIWVGLRREYSDIIHTIEDVREICDEFIDDRGGDCITITPTEYRYLNGNEPGVIIGYINYPRFPKIEPKDEIADRALQLAEMLRVGLGQIRVSVTTPDKTYMLE